MALFVTVLFISTCRSGSPLRMTDAERLSVDSLIYANRESSEDLDSLLDLFTDRGNDYGCMKAYQEMGKLLREKGDFPKERDRRIPHHPFSSWKTTATSPII